MVTYKDYLCVVYGCVFLYNVHLLMQRYTETFHKTDQWFCCTKQTANDKERTIKMVNKAKINCCMWQKSRPSFYLFFFASFFCLFLHWLHKIPVFYKFSAWDEKSNSHFHNYLCSIFLTKSFWNCFELIVSRFNETFSINFHRPENFFLSLNSIVIALI